MDMVIIKRSEMHVNSLIVMVVGTLIVCVSCGWRRDRQQEMWSSQQRSAEIGDAEAQERLAVRYELGEGVSKDLKQSFCWALKAAEQGHPEAQYDVATKYKEGNGVAVNPNFAFGWYRKCAVNGTGKWQGKAAVALSVAYFAGEGVPKNIGISLEWATRAAIMGDSTGCYCLGAWMLRRGHSLEEEHMAKTLMEAAASNGLKEAQYHLAELLSNGEFIEKDPVKAAIWAKKSAEQGFAKGQYSYALFLQNGQGVAKDEQESIKWMMKAADQGIPEALSVMGTRYLEGRGVAKDSVLGVDYIRRGMDGMIQKANQDFEKGTINSQERNQIMQSARLAKNRIEKAFPKEP